MKGEASFEHLLARYGVKTRGLGEQRMALCPFHPDRKPSCSIHLERNVFHCFGCGAKGSVLDFVARMENVSIREAAARIEEICRHTARRAPAARDRCERETATAEIPISHSSLCRSGSARPVASIPVSKRHQS